MERDRCRDSGGCGGEHCCAVSLLQWKYKLAPRVHCHHLLPPWTSKAHPSPSSEAAECLKGKTVHLATLLDSRLKGESASTSHGHWSLEGCSHKQSAGGHVIFSLPFLPSSQRAKCNAWHSKYIGWQNVLVYRGDLWQPITYTSMNRQFLLICPHCFRDAVKPYGWNNQFLIRACQNRANDSSNKQNLPSKLRWIQFLFLLNIGDF